ncbi:hypothetical protein [Streptomyces sp. Tu 2975]|uniref:hypothetical protein n=1 Tax=Streptomyces sp. Tu 2975 TaxID=2676871 RepID=UPI001FC93E64|nr:hypothetical protein [Streptomyces sp. Tu 2975]
MGVVEGVGEGGEVGVEGVVEVVDGGVDVVVVVGGEVVVGDEVGGVGVSLLRR